ncbi:2-amino-4-hydroxy-6-hydroxymethyldihydropteridine diphosphokinase [Chloroflexota bacterium]
MDNDVPITVYLGLGSNIRDRKDNLDKALELLSERLRINKVSSIYETEPMGNTNQPRFLNMVCEVSTNLGPKELLTLAKSVESKLGRVFGNRNMPRPIDVDILFFGDEIINIPDLVIPHPRLTTRAFVLVPLAELAPDMVYPRNKKTVSELLNAVDKNQGVSLWENR